MMEGKHKIIKKLLLLIISLTLILTEIHLSDFDVYAAGYNPSTAASWAVQNYNIASGQCAEFVSKCLQAGGCDITTQRIVGGLNRELSKRSEFTRYQMTRFGKSSELEAIGANAGKVAIGDILVFYNGNYPSAPYMHTAIVTGINSKGVVSVTQKNSNRTGMHYLWTFKNSSGNMTALYCFHYNGGAAADTTPPVISNVYVKKNLIGYDVYCDVSDNVGVTKVAFPTWTIKNGQDDLQNPWPVGSQYRQNANGTITYKFNVKASDHNYEQGYYATHIYAYDAAGNQSFAAVSSNICLDWAMPDISDIKIVDQSSSGFSVQCKVTDNIGLSQVYCTASSENIKRADKLEGTNNGDIYSFRVNTNDYNGECGIYYIRIYATDQCGNDAIAKAEYTVEAPVKKYTVTFDSQGGTSIAAIKDIVENTKIDKLPDPPTKSDYEFVGWYTEAGGKGVKFDENTVINQDMTVYAFWRLKVPDVPKSFWVDDIPDQTYIGKAVKPRVFVYDGSSLLQENIDYTLTYKKNKKVSDTAPYVIVRGIGDYSGTERVSFSILPKNIAEDDIEIGNLTVAYYDRVKSAVPTVKWGNKKLEYKKDFKIKYPETDEDPYFVEGRYPIEIVGKGNYTGKRTVQITIRNKKPIKKITVKKIKKQPYSGYSITPELVVKDGRIRLEEDVDYTVSYQNNVNAGTATVVLTGMGKYGGEKRVSFKITRINLKRAVISDIPESIAYTEGDIAIEPRLEIMVGERNVVLKKDEDYTVNVRKNKNADTATVVIKGINNYSGTVKKRIELIPQ